MEDKYIIKSFDELNVVVQERFEKKEKIKKIVINEEGNEAEKTEWIGTGIFEYKSVSYHPNIEKAYNWIIDKEINSSYLEDIKEVVNKINELKENMKFIAVKKAKKLKEEE